MADTHRSYRIWVCPKCGAQWTNPELGPGCHSLDPVELAVVAAAELEAYEQTYFGRVLAENRRLADLIRRLLPGWASDDANYAAYEEARAAVGETMTDGEILHTAGLQALEELTRTPESVPEDRGLVDLLPDESKRGTDEG